MRADNGDDRLAIAAEAFVASGDALFSAQRYHEALARYAEVVERLVDARTGDFADHVLTALLRIGAVYMVLGRLDEAEATFGSVLRRAEAAPSSGPRLRSALKMIVDVFEREVGASLEAERFADALAASDLLIRFLGHDLPQGRVGLIVDAQRLKAWALERCDRVDEALEILTEAVERYRGVDERDVRVSVIKALNNCLKLLGDPREYERAIEACDEIVALAETTQPRVLEPIVDALKDKVALLCRIERYQEALAVEDEAIARFGEHPLPGLHVALDSLHNKALILNKIGRTRESIASLEELVRAYGEQSEPYVMGKVAYAQRMQTLLLVRAGRYEEAIAAVDELLGRFGEVEETSVRLSVAEGLNEKAFALGRLGHWEAAVGVDEQAIERFSTTEADRELAEVLARVMGHHAFSLERLGHLEQADAAWQALIERDRDAASMVPSDIVGDAWQKRVTLLALMGRSKDAIALADEFMPGLREDPEQLMRLVEALAVKGFALVALECWDEAVDVFDEIVERGQDLDDHTARREVVLALMNKSVALREQGRYEEWVRFSEEISSRIDEDGLEAFTEVIDSLANAAAEPSVRPVLASATFHKAELLVERERRAEALATVTELIDRFEEDDQANIEGIVVLARDLQERLVSESDDLD